MYLEHFIEFVLPPIIALLDLIGIFIITAGSLRAFFHYLGNIFFKDTYNFKFVLFEDMATGLEFKMAAEILKTVLIRTLDELVILGAVILLRGLMALMVRLEMRAECAQIPTQTPEK